MRKTLGLATIAVSVALLPWYPLASVALLVTLCIAHPALHPLMLIEPWGLRDKATGQTWHWQQLTLLEHQAEIMSRARARHAVLDAHAARFPALSLTRGQSQDQA